MAKREALRELQSRLAQRLQAALTELPSASWLAVHCGGLGLIFPLRTAGEIFTAAGVLPVPHTQPWFLGVANLRGGLHGVVDLAASWACASGRWPWTTWATRPGCWRSTPVPGPLRGAGRPPGRPAQPGQLTRLPDTPQARPGFAGAVYRDTQGQVWQEIDLAALAQQEQFLGIAA
jgi:twitching motility protein PilI